MSTRATFSTETRSRSFRGELAPNSIPISALEIPYVDELPKAPGDGSMVIFQASSGINWWLRYNARNDLPSYPWEYVGGPSLYAEVTTEEAIASSSYGDPSTAGPAISLPLPGQYDVSVGAHCYDPGATGVAYMSYADGSAAAADTHAAKWENIDGSTNRHGYSGMRQRRRTFSHVPALTAKYRASTGGVDFADRWIKAVPVQVGRP